MFAEICSDQIFSNHFKIQSVTWITENYLLILGESDYLLGVYQNERVFIVDTQKRYKYNGFELKEAEIYEGIYSWSFKDQTLLVAFHKDGQFDLVSRDSAVKALYVNKYTIEDNMLINLVLNQDGEGFCFEKFSVGDDYNEEEKEIFMAMFDFNGTIPLWLNCWRRPRYHVVQSKDTFRFNFMIVEWPKGFQRLFDVRPSGFIHETEMFLIDSVHSQIYVLNYTYLRAHSEDGSITYEHIKQKPFDQFFVCDMNPTTTNFDFSKIIGADTGSIYLIICFLMSLLLLSCICFFCLMRKRRQSKNRNRPPPSTTSVLSTSSLRKATTTIKSPPNSHRSHSKKAVKKKKNP